MYRVNLVYFRPTGKYLASVETTVTQETIEEIWEEIHELRRIGRLPGLRPNAGRDLLIVVDVPDHPTRVPYLAIPPRVDEEDVTPLRVPTGEMVPLVRVPLEEIPRTTTRDVVKIDPEVAKTAASLAPNTKSADEEITPVDPPIVSPQDKPDE